MRKAQGFTVIEFLLFLIITGLFASAGIYALKAASSTTITGHGTLVAVETAQQCIEYLAGQSSENGFASIACPSTAVPSFCTAPSGYSISVNVACTTLSSDSNYKTITVTVGGNGNATLTLLIAAT